MATETINPEFTEEQLAAVAVDIQSYEFRERIAILQENNPDMHARHAYNKAVKEIRVRILTDRRAARR